MNAFSVKTSNRPMVMSMSNESAGILFKALFDFAEGSAVAEEQPIEVRAIFAMFAEDIKRADEISRKRAEAGRNGGLAKSSKTKQTVAKPSKPKQNLANPSKTEEHISKDIDSPLQSSNLQSSDTERERREKLKEKNEKASPSTLMQNPGVKAAWDDFVKMRKTIKKPLTDNAMLRAWKRLEEMCGGDAAKAVRILNNTTDHCWQDLYDKTDGARTVPVKPNSFGDFPQRKPGDVGYVDLDAMVRGEL